MASLLDRPRLLRVVFGLASLLPLVQACGGRSDMDEYLVGEDGAISSGANSGAGRGSGASSSGASRPGGSHAGGSVVGAGGSSAIGGGVGTAGAPTMGGRPSVGGTNASGAARGGTGGRGGAGHGGVAMGGSAVGGTGVAGAPDGSTITCGAQTCDASTQTCCAGLAGLGCIANNKRCNGAALDCTTSADCGGDGVCCLSLAGGAMISSSCEASCGGFGRNGGPQLCGSDTDCAPPGRCLQTPFGLSFCTPGRPGGGPRGR